MIINIRGTSGSGKSTLVRRLRELYDGSMGSYHVAGRKQPIGYLHNRLDGGPALAVVGHYETACGGCDTIPKMEKIFELVRESHRMGVDVIFEGLLISADFKRTAALHEDGLPLTVIGLDTPIDVCLSSINERRRAKKPEATDVNPRNTESKYKGVQSSMRKFQEAGIPAHWHSRDSALAFLRQELKI